MPTDLDSLGTWVGNNKLNPTSIRSVHLQHVYLIFYV